MNVKIVDVEKVWKLGSCMDSRTTSNWDCGNDIIKLLIALDLFIGVTTPTKQEYKEQLYVFGMGVTYVVDSIEVIDANLISKLFMDLSIEQPFRC